MQGKEGLSQLDKKVIGILLIATLALVLAASLSYFLLDQPNQTLNIPSPTPTPTQTSSGAPTESEPLPKPSIPEFTLEVVDRSYDIPATIDPYTGQDQPGIHIKSIRVGVKIKNQPLTYQTGKYDGSESINFFYNIRYKGRFTDEWIEPYGNRFENYITANYSSEYTFVTLYQDFSDGAQIDIQVEAMMGNPSYSPFAPTVFTGEKSSWSETQTITLP